MVAQTFTAFRFIGVGFAVRVVSLSLTGLTLVFEVSAVFVGFLL